MAFFYTGPRSVLRGDNTNDWVHPYKGTGTYSNYSIWSTNHILEGAPILDVEPGEGNHPHGIHLSRRFRGLDTLSPLDNPGSDPELAWHFSYADVLLKRGEGAQGVLTEVDTNVRDDWDPWEFHGVANAPLNDPGFEEPANHASYKGARTYAPYDDYGVGEDPMVDPGVAVEDKPTGNQYAFQKVNEWKGVPSARVL